ncbi:hypothetical protein [Microbacterium sp.]|uniref:hypothetical protein n=1 Tax=Microbacterium sp. TaxID=51671 RepID=UPI0039E592B5
MTRPVKASRLAVSQVEAADVSAPMPDASMLPVGFDTAAWTRAACEASGVPFAVEDPVALAKLRDLVEHPA